MNELMHIRPGKIIFFFSALVLSWWASAGAQVVMDLTLELPRDVEAVAWRDLLTEDEKFSGILFTAAVRAVRPVKNVYFHFALQSTEGEILEGDTRVFDLCEGTTPFSNLDLTLPAASYRLDDFQATPQAMSLRRRMRDTGYLPPGEYRLTVTLIQPGKEDSVLAADEAKITLKNPFDIELVKPSGTPANPRLVSLDDLTFQWSSAARRFLLTIWEKPEILGDGYQLQVGKPIYQTDRNRPLRAKRFEFTSTDLRLFKPGRAYLWKVTALVKTSRGIVEIDSPLAAFEVSPNAAESVALSVFLKKVVGHDAAVWDDLSGFQPTGRIRLDGKWISLEELLQMAADFETGAYKIVAVESR